MNLFLTQNQQFSRTTSFLFVCFVYLISLIICYLAIPFLASTGDFWTVFWLDILATSIVFGASSLFRNASIYDPYWSVAPIPILLYWWSLSEWDTSDFRKILLVFAVFFWASRLTLNWARGWSGLAHEDWRYGMLRQKTGQFYPLVNFSGIHLFPTLIVFAACIPLYFVLTQEQNTEVNWMDWMGFCMCIGGALLELFADEQLRNFKRKNTENPQAFINEGLWRYSRHPNYFGEILFWTGLFFIALSANAELYWTAFGWLAMFLMFQFISIPMMEKRMLAKRPEYANYIQKVPRLVLGFPRK